MSYEVTDDDQRMLAERARALGATEGEITASADVGTLVLDLTLRPRSGVTVGDVIAETGLDEAVVLRILQASGIPSSADIPISAMEADTIRLLATAGRDLLGEDVVVQLGRVAGQAMSRVAEALVTAFRLRFEVPQREQGVAFADLVEGYASIVETLLPSFVQSLDVLLRQSILGVAGWMWSLDEEGAAVTQPRAVGFADLVGFTARASNMSARELTAELIEFDECTSMAALRAGGRIVKTIGDEAMFVAEDETTACRIGLDIVRSFGASTGRPAVRVGISAGPVVSVFGDVYGTVVNLAARLVAAADPSTVLVSEGVAAACAGTDLDVEPVGPLPLKGFDAPVPAYRLRSAAGP